MLSWSSAAYSIEDNKIKTNNNPAMEPYIDLLSSILQLTSNLDSTKPLGNSTQFMTIKFDEFMSKVMSPEERFKCVNSNEVQYLNQKAKICELFYTDIFVNFIF